MKRLDEEEYKDVTVLRSYILDKIDKKFQHIQIIGQPKAVLFLTFTKSPAYCLCKIYKKGSKMYTKLIQR